MLLTIEAVKIADRIILLEDRFCKVKNEVSFRKSTKKTRSTLYPANEKRNKRMYNWRVKDMLKRYNTILFSLLLILFPVVGCSSQEKTSNDPEQKDSSRETEVKEEQKL
ncbi:hypothetical protein KHA80_14960 [Anaerobacillus sp. HL2]|nr:hypothetical protein KHA80_14960 [Anaerobacillus sp. HL2]